MSWVLVVLWRAGFGRGCVGYNAAAEAAEAAKVAATLVRERERERGSSSSRMLCTWERDEGKRRREEIGGMKGEMEQDKTILYEKDDDERWFGEREKKKGEEGIV